MYEDCVPCKELSFVVELTKIYHKALIICEHIAGLAEVETHFTVFITMSLMGAYQILRGCGHIIT